MSEADLTPAQVDAITEAVRQAADHGDHVTPEQFKAGVRRACGRRSPACARFESQGIIGYGRPVVTLTMTLKDPKPDSYGLMRYIFNGMKRGCTVYLPKSMFENGKASEEITISGAGLVMPPNPEIVSSLREENEALRKRLAELEKGRG